MLLSASSSSFLLSFGPPVDCTRLKPTMTAMPARKKIRHRETARRQSSSGGKLSKTRSIVPACLFAVLLAQQLADIHLRFVNQRPPPAIRRLPSTFQDGLVGIDPERPNGRPDDEQAGGDDE